MLNILCANLLAVLMFIAMFLGALYGTWELGLWVLQKLFQ